MIQQRIEFYGLEEEEPIEEDGESEIVSLAKAMCSSTPISVEVFETLMEKVVEEYMQQGDGIPREAAEKICASRLRYIISNMNPGQYHTISEHYFGDTGEVND